MNKILKNKKQQEVKIIPVEKVLINNGFAIVRQKPAYKALKRVGKAVQQ